MVGWATRRMGLPLNSLFGNRQLNGAIFSVCPTFLYPLRAPNERPRASCLPMGMVFAWGQVVAGALNHDAGQM